MARTGRKQGVPALSATHTPDIHACGEFEAILSCERARADRAGSRFAVVAIELAGQVDDRNELKRLARALRGRARSTDVLGWLDGETLGVLLPCTDLQGARIFAVNFEKQYYVRRAPAPFTVYCYPDRWLHDGNGSSSAGHACACGRPREGDESLDRRVEDCMERSVPRRKMVVDVTQSRLGLVPSAPPFLAVPAYVKVVSPGPVFYRQRWIGHRARPFTFLKSGTMRVNNDAAQHKAYLKKLINSKSPMKKLNSDRDRRITAGGKAIRKACPDDFPQLINVLKSEISKTKPSGQLHPCVLSSREFVRDMTGERDRADRDNSAFSIVSFKPSDDKGSSRIDDGLSRMLLSRIRRTDSVGRLDDGHLCVLMPTTGKNGAKKFADDVMRMTKLGYSAFRISCYPNDTTKPAASYNDAGYSHIEKAMQPYFVQELPVWKRAMDIVGSLSLLVCLSPLLILTALYIKIVSPGPILYKQERVGHKGKTFIFLKFRTMKQNNDVDVHKKHAAAFINSDIPMGKLDDSGDSRIILGGRVLRKACLDELPQLYNILKGEMSLVGPRPCIPYEAEEYFRWHARRFDLMPGLTGLWQVSGKNKLTFKEMVRLDISYEKNLSFWLDVGILMRTIPAVLQLVFEAAGRKIMSMKW